MKYSPVDFPATVQDSTHELADMFLHAAKWLKEVKMLRSIPFCGDDQPSGAVPIHFSCFPFPRWRDGGGFVSFDGRFAEEPCHYFECYFVPLFDSQVGRGSHSVPNRSSLPSRELRILGIFPKIILYFSKNSAFPFPFIWIAPVLFPTPPCS
ncbi:uncharacterized protein BJX67DRAFT_125754 [Aspergillus lucknowensis]|uniref:Uncharacterized protein n=1 Tax=Aspergillus lucknowensis TaxID=176173 RepID=A0ABR4LQL2_9EURO